MKKLIAVLSCLILYGSLYAQQGSVGIGTQTPNEKAVLHLVAPNNDQGFLIPKMTTAQKTSFGNGLTANENGMMVYDTDFNRFYFWMSDHWEEVGPSLQAGTGINIANGVISNTGDWADLNNIPADFADGTDEVDDADADPTNELQDLDLTSNILTISGLATPTQINLASYQGTNTDEQDLRFISGQITLTGDPDNTVIDLSNYDTDVTDDFSGNWLDLAGIPAGFSDGTDDVDDADNDPTNEIELPASATSGQVLKYSGTAWIAGTDNVDDGDTDDTNELQDLDLTSNILTITGLSSPTQIDLAPYAGTNTDAQDLQFSDGLITLSGDPDNTEIDLAPYMDNTDLLTGITGPEGSVLKYFPLDGGWQASTDFVDDADADPTNEIEFPTTATLGYVMKFNDANSWSPAPDQVNDADPDPTNEIELPASAADGAVLKYSTASGTWIEGTDNTADGDTSPTNEIELVADSDKDGNKYREYQDGNYLKALNFMSGQMSADDTDIKSGILDISPFKFARTLLFTPDSGKGSSIAEIKINNGITGQELIFINVGTMPLSFPNSASNSNLYVPDAASIGPGGSIHLMYVDDGKFKGWITLSYVPSVGSPGSAG